MTPLSVRPANPGDLPALAAIYRAARAFMAASGNPTQWGTTDPRPELLRQDIAQEQLYVLCDGDTPRAAFALVPGRTPPTPSLTAPGSATPPTPPSTGWAATAPATVSLPRPSAGRRPRQPHLRIDTHADNHIMQKLIARAGFRCCGIIHVADGSPRLAYERLPG